MFTAICRQVIFFSLAFLTLGASAQGKTTLLTQARELYKKGEYAKAAGYYERIPQDNRDYLRTREELAWSYLRAGDWTRLRGVLAHLNTDLVPLRWRLEGRVMASMIHLRECQYEKVKEQMALFQKEMGPLVKSIDAQASKSAHGPYWAALREEVGEALLKMKFVKMELRSRLVMLTREQVVDPQSTKGLNDEVALDGQTFPIDDDIWIDELFLARGSGRGACTEIHKARATL